MAQQNNSSSAKRLREWKAILMAPPDMEVVSLIVASLPHDLALCCAMPRHGFWFNKTRQIMKVDPKTLRQILVKGREASVAQQSERRKQHTQHGKARIESDICKH